MSNTTELTACKSPEIKYSKYNFHHNETLPMDCIDTRSLPTGEYSDLEYARIFYNNAVECGDFDGAYLHLKYIFEADPGSEHDVCFWNQLAYVWDKLGRQPESQVVLIYASSLPMVKRDDISAMASVLHRLSRHSEALQLSLVTAVLEQHDQIIDRATELETLADAAASSNDPKKAIACYEQAVMLYDSVYQQMRQLPIYLKFEYERLSWTRAVANNKMAHLRFIGDCHAVARRVFV